MNDRLVVVRKHQGNDGNDEWMVMVMEMKKILVVMVMQVAMVVEVTVMAVEVLMVVMVGNDAAVLYGSE